MTTDYNKDIETQYLDALEHILLQGETKDDRTGTGTKQVFGVRMEHDLRKGFPLLTTKRVFWKGVITELLWMIQGDTNIDYLQQNGVRIWNEWADEDGNLGPVYGHQWRGFGTAQIHVQDGETRKALPLHVEFEGIDQLYSAQETIKSNPNSRRILVSAWNPSQMSQMRLPPCHLLFQFNVSSDGDLDLEMYQRSADMFLGVPFDIASYAALLHMMAAVTGKKARRLGFTFADSHIYSNHFDAVREQLSRRSMKHPLPRLVLPPTPENIWEYTKYDPEQFVIEGYGSEKSIKAPIAV